MKAERPQHCPLYPDKERVSYEVKNTKYFAKETGPTFLIQKQETLCAALVVPDIYPGQPTKADCKKCGTELQIEPETSIWSGSEKE